MPTPNIWPTSVWRGRGHLLRFYGTCISFSYLDPSEPIWHLKPVGVRKSLWGTVHQAYPASPPSVRIH